MFQCNVFLQFLSTLSDQSEWSSNHLSIKTYASHEQGCKKSIVTDIQFRYSFLFFSSNTPTSLLFYSIIEYAVLFTFLALVSIFFIGFFLGAIKSE